MIVIGEGAIQMGSGFFGVGKLNEFHNDFVWDVLMDDPLGSLTKGGCVLALTAIGIGRDIHHFQIRERVKQPTLFQLDAKVENAGRMRGIDLLDESGRNSAYTVEADNIAV